MAAVTPLAGLLKWCILSPTQASTTDKDVLEEENDLYAKLHLALLESLREAGPATGPSSVLSVQHLVSVIQPIQMKVAELVKTGKGIRKDLLLQVRFEFQIVIKCSNGLFARKVYT